MQINTNHVVFVLAILLALSVYVLMTKYGIPSKIAWGSAILCILVVSIFWTAVTLNLDDDDED